MPNARLGRLAPVPVARSNVGRALPTSPASAIPQGGFVARSGIQGVPIGGYAPRRRLTRRNTSRKVPRAYQEEEGYASGEENDAPFELINLKIRVKVETYILICCVCGLNLSVVAALRRRHTRDGGDPQDNHIQRVYGPSQDQIRQGH
jgi:hypothetical protein